MTMTQEECERHVKNSLASIQQDINKANDKIDALTAPEAFERNLTWVESMTDVLFELRSSLEMFRLFSELDAGTKPMPWLKSTTPPSLDIKLEDLGL